MNINKVVVINPANTAVKVSLDVSKLVRLSRDADRNVYDDVKDAVEAITVGMAANKTNVMLFGEGGKLVSYKDKVSSKYKIPRVIRKTVANLNNFPTAE